MSSWGLNELNWQTFISFLSKIIYETLFDSKYIFLNIKKNKKYFLESQDFFSIPNINWINLHFEFLGLRCEMIIYLLNMFWDKIVLESTLWYRGLFDIIKIFIYLIS